MEYPLTYPTIKCNINKSSGTRLYHLPTDPHYDRIKIDKSKGNHYCFTKKEAEDMGFIRSRAKEKNHRLSLVNNSHKS